MKHWVWVLLLLVFLLAACEEASLVSSSTGELTVLPTDTRQMTLLTPTFTWPSPSATALPEPTETLDARLLPENWQEWPVIPETFSLRLREIYARGLSLGNNPQAYSKIGDCEATPAWFLGPFDGNPQGYSLGEYAYLQTVIDHFRGSHKRMSLAAGRGYNTSNVLLPLWADPTVCAQNESPLECEIRLHRPAFAFVMLGTNDVYHQDNFDENMRRIIDILIAHGVIPILATKADNLEGDHSINLQIARLAYQYEIPLWNFWRAVQPLPNHGLQEDGAHLTWAEPFFDDPWRMKAAWPWRNLTALQVLDATWRAVTGTP